MTEISKQLSPIRITEPLTPGTLFSAVLDTPVLRPRLNIGRVTSEGKMTTLTGKKVEIRRPDATIGKWFVIHEII